MLLDVGKPFLNAQEIKFILLMDNIATLMHFHFHRQNSNVCFWAAAAFINSLFVAL